MSGISDAQSLADLLPDGVIVADANQQVVMVSATAAKMLGVSGSEVLGATLAEVLRLQDTEGRDWLACNTPYSGLMSRSAIPEQSWLLPDGTEVLVAARLQRAGRGDPVSAVALALRSGRGRARLDRERSDLVATVAHELRSPLTGVKGFVQALLNRWDRLSDDQKKLMLTTVSADADRLARLIAELLDVARIDTGRLQLYPRPSDVATLVGRIVESVAAGTSASIELDVHDDLPQILVDPDKFTQVITNLVENGVRHGEGTVRVTLRLSSAVSPEGVDEPVLQIVVTDEGEGIAVEQRRQVFTKFWRGGARGGSGLGLYLVNGLARAQGATVLIDDAPGGGARITTTWPIDRASSAAE